MERAVKTILLGKGAFAPLLVDTVLVEWRE